MRAGKVIVDKEGNPVAGVEPERGNWTGNVAMNGKITIPDGHHGGGGYVNGPAVTQRGAWNGAVGMNTQVAIPEGYHNGAGKVSGPSVAFQNADVAGTDRANATNRSCWDGTICLGVRNNHYLNGVNWIQFSDPNFRASNFKKGVPIMGLIGTFEGYVPTPTDLYLRGNNIAGIQSYYGTAINSEHIFFESGSIYFDGYASSKYTLSIYRNLTGYNSINVELNGASDSGLFNISVTNILNGGFELHSQTTGLGNRVASLNISSINASRWLNFYTANQKIYIYRIWLS